MERLLGVEDHHQQVERVLGERGEGQLDVHRDRAGRRRKGGVYTAGVARHKVAVLGVPTAAGARGPGVERAPFALREAGLLFRLKADGATVVNLSDLSLFPHREDAAHPRARNAEVVACALRATADEMTRALPEGFTVVLGGDCTLSAAVAAGAGRALGEAVGVVYVDANADLNTPETSPSGYLDGMALALALGRGAETVVAALGPAPAVQPGHVALVGFRELDPGERGALGELGLALPASAARKLGMRVTAALALDGVENGDGPVVVHLDVDAIDPSEMPAKQVSTPGPALSLAEVSDLVTALVASPRVVAFEVAEYDPQRDPDRSNAGKLVDLIARAVARRLRGPHQL
ncbi:MAG: arginase [Acidobacteria bacterium]|nr:MAG: arginase [Acidobacteriota bacterium]